MKLEVQVQDPRARDAGARVVFVNPASNLRDFSPFKSEHADSVAAETRILEDTPEVALSDARTQILPEEEPEHTLPREPDLSLSDARTQILEEEAPEDPDVDPGPEGRGGDGA